MTAWILSLLVLLVPRAPYSDTFAATAAAIDRAAHEAPLYTGEDGPERTAADLVALAFFESAFDPRAVGDHGRSLGLGQIGVSNLQSLGVQHDELFDADTNMHAALTMMRLSHVVCRVRPKSERLGHYAAGGSDCTRGLRESRHRTELAARLLREHPVRWTETTRPAS